MRPVNSQHVKASSTHGTIFISESVLKTTLEERMISNEFPAGNMGNTGSLIFYYRLKPSFHTSSKQSAHPTCYMCTGDVHVKFMQENFHDGFFSRSTRANSPR